MTGLQSFFAVVAAIVLFIYGLQGFSRELRAVGGDVLQTWLGRVTANRWSGFAVGAFATAVVQSSSAVTSLTTALVDSSVISFRASLGVLLGRTSASSPKTAMSILFVWQWRSLTFTMFAPGNHRK